MKQMIWIRKENYDKWATIKDKSAFVNDALNQSNVPTPSLATTKKARSTITDSPSKDYSVLLKPKGK